MKITPGLVYVVIHPWSQTNNSPRYLVTTFAGWAAVANRTAAGYTFESFDTFAQAHAVCNEYNYGTPVTGVEGGVHVCNDVCAGKVRAPETHTYYNDERVVIIRDNVERATVTIVHVGDEHQSEAFDVPTSRIEYRAAT